MKVQNINDKTYFGSLKLNGSIERASYRGCSVLEKEAVKLVKLAEDVDISVRKKFFQNISIDTPTDFVIKVSELQPEAKTVLAKVKNLVKKPFLISKENIAGKNFGTFDDPLEVAAKTKNEVLEKVKLKQILQSSEK